MGMAMDHENWESQGGTASSGIATYLPGHGRPLSSICWARNGRLLLTCSVDR
eukprot:COSAG06_NODE_18499_length_884_cov_6.721019_1_plen_51_part_01